MPQTTKTTETTATIPNTDNKTTLILVIVFGSVSVLLLAYIAVRVTIGSRKPGMRPAGQYQLQQGRRIQGVQPGQPKNNMQSADPMQFDEEMNLN